MITPTDAQQRRLVRLTSGATVRLTYVAPRKSHGRTKGRSPGGRARVELRPGVYVSVPADTLTLIEVA